MSEKPESRVIFIAGPTASGKSAAALALAERFDAEIVNADAMQVYRDLRILSARPGDDDLARAPHHLFGVIDAAMSCSAGMWSRLAKETIDAVAARGRVAIVVGGTGLYFRALGEGLSPIPDIPTEIRAAVRQRFAEIGAEAFRAETMARDPAAAKLPPGDSQRLQRLREVVEATGRPLSAFQSDRRALIVPPVAGIVIEPDRAALYASCEARFDLMLAKGGLEEARTLLARGLDPDLPAMKALGAAELMAHLKGDHSLEAAVAQAKRNTRHFAKRQLTWFRNQAPGWARAGSAAEAVAATIGQLRETPAFP